MYQGDTQKFEAMVKELDPNNNERALRRLTETAIITGQYEVAKKYIYILENDYDCGKWAKQMKQLAEHPELIGRHAAFKKLRESYEKTEDEFFL